MRSVVCALPFLMAGCYTGDPEARSVVVLDFPVSQHLSATDPGIQEALRIIDEAFVSNGFTRDRHALAPEDEAHGIIASYGAHNVCIEGHSLIVRFFEFGRSRSSPIVRQTCSLMKEKLSKRFGVQRVTAEIDR